MIKAEIVNILEEHVETLHLKSAKLTSLASIIDSAEGEGEDGGVDRSSEVKLDFRGFEIKTVRLTIGSGEKGGKGKDKDGDGRVKLSAGMLRQMKVTSSVGDDWIEL